MGSGTAVASIVLLLAMIASGSVVAPIPGQAGSVSPGAPSGAATVRGAFLPVHPPGLRPVGGAQPLASSPFYTQVGATLGELNNSASITGLRSLSLRFTLVNSPYPIGYELNGLSDTGDWYQVLVGDGWPGCPGYEMLFELWASSGQGYAPGCDTTLTLHTGDLIQLGINFTSASVSANVCLDLWDVTHATEHSICSAQPDSGASEFVTLSTAANGNGFFTGPMTEIANSSAVSCPDYRSMPVLSYDFPATEHISAYSAWSDEFLAGSYLCYSQGTTDSFTRSDPSTHFYDTAGGTSYGPHYVAAQNYSYVDPAYGSRIETDPIPLTGATLATDASVLAVGGVAHLTTSVTGGSAPYSALWYLNGTPLGVGSTSRTFSTNASGVYRFTSYGVDANLQVVGPSNAVSIQVNSPLAATSVAVNTTGGGGDVGQLVRISVAESGGIPPYAYAWSGLPAACPGANADHVDCRPDQPGSYNVSVTVTDSNGSAVTAGPVPFLVSPALVPSVALSTLEIDLNQSLRVGWSVAGGSGGYTATWTGLPPGCAPPGGLSAVCTPTAAGVFDPSVRVVDSNDASVTATAAPIVVHPYLAASLLMSRTTLDAGVNVTITSRVVGGVTPYTFLWSGLPDGCVAANTSVLTCAPSTGGTYAITLAVSDPLGGGTSSPTLTFFVSPPLGVAIAGTPNAVVGGTLTLDATTTGGSAGALLRWSGLPDGCAPPSGTHLSCQPTTAGTYNVTVSASDSGGGSATTVLEVTIGYPAAVASPWQSPWVLYGAIAGGVVVVVALAAYALRRGKAGESPGESDAYR